MLSPLARSHRQRTGRSGEAAAMALKAVNFLALALTALALVPVGAHLFALPNKIALTQEAYFTVQGIYRGWALFGIVLCGALLANLLLAIMLRARGRPAGLAFAAFILVGMTLVIFFAWTYPANQATDNWTAVPENWRALRTQWEYSHAANAVLTFLAFCAVALSSLTAGDRG
jgi:hypothetical protein